MLLRKRQYALSEDEGASLGVARSFITGKVYNARWVLERGLRDHGMRIDADAVRGSSLRLRGSLGRIADCGSEASLRGVEGDAAAEYFGVVGSLCYVTRSPSRSPGGIGGRRRIALTRCSPCSTPSS